MIGSWFDIANAQGFFGAGSHRVATTALTPVSVFGLANATLQIQVAQFNARKLAEDQSVVVASFLQRINSIDRDAGAVQGVIDFLDRVVGRVGSIRANLDSATSFAVLARNGTAQSFSGLARSFNASLNALNNAAESGFDSPNLLGANGTSSFSYIATDNAATRTVAHKYLGTDYSITDSGGDRWIREGDFTKILVQIDPATGAKTGKKASVNDGLRLDSIAGNAVTFTINFKTSDAEQFTGTLSRSGLEVLDAWLYEGLETVAGRARAIDDIAAAKATLDVHRARFRAAIAEATFYLGRADNQVTAFSGLIGDLTIKQAVALQEAESDAERRNTATLFNLQSAFSTRNAYLKLLASVGNDPFTRALIDINA